MPNWCSNNITIQGPTETIKALWEDDTEIVGENNEERGLLEAMVPMPEQLRNTVKGSGDDLQTEVYDGATNWYDWAVNRWGTKWDVSSEGLEFTDNGDGTASIQGWFESAWAPPIEAYNNFLDDMDNCSIVASYYEPGMDFAGFYDNGIEEHMDNLHDQYELPEAERSPLFKRLDEEYDLVYQFQEWDEMNAEMDN